MRENKTIFVVVSILKHFEMHCMCLHRQSVGIMNSNPKCLYHELRVSKEPPRSRKKELHTIYLKGKKTTFEMLQHMHKHSAVQNREKKFLERKDLHRKNQRLMVSSQSRAVEEFISDGLKRIMSVLAGNRTTQQQKKGNTCAGEPKIKGGKL